MLVVETKGSNISSHSQSSYSKHYAHVNLFAARLPVWLMVFVWQVCLYLLVNSKHSFGAKPLISQDAYLDNVCVENSLRMNDVSISRDQSNTKSVVFNACSIYRHSLILLNERWNSRSLLRCPHPFLGEKSPYSSSSLDFKIAAPQKVVLQLR